MFYGTDDLKKRGRAKKWISLFLSVCLLSGSAEAAAVPSSTAPSQMAASLNIPSEFGAVQEFHPGTSGKTVIYIQDAHDVLEAQENIAAIITHLVESQNVKTVYEEGYEGALPTDTLFQDISDRELKKKVSYYFLDQLKIGGAEYAHINRIRDFKLQGADSFKDHFENVDWYSRTVQTQADVEAELLSVEKELENLTKALGLKPLQSLLRAKKRFEEHQTDFVTYLREICRLYLESPAGENLESSYPSLTRMLRAVDTKQAELLDGVNQQGTAAEVFFEIKRLEDALAEALLKDGRDRELYGHTKAVRLLRRLNKMEVTPAEYWNSQKILDSFRTQDLADFLAREGKKTIVLPRRWEESLGNARGFYETALRRDEKIRQAMVSFAANSEEKTAVLVYGGFHAEGIRQILAQAGIGYVFVSPKIQHFEQRHQEYYRQSMGRGSRNFSKSAAPRMARPLSVFQMEAYGEPKAREAVRTEIRRLEAVMGNLSGDLPQAAREARLALSITHQDLPEAQARPRSELRIAAEESSPEERAEREIHAFMQSFQRRLAVALDDAGEDASQAPAVFREALRSLVFWNGGLRKAARDGGLETEKTGALILMFNYLAEAFYHYHYGLVQKVERESADEEGRVYKAEVVEALRRAMSDADIDLLSVPQFIEMYEDTLGQWRGSGQFDYLMNHYLPYMFTAERERVEQFMAKTDDDFPMYLNVLQTLMWFYEEWAEFSRSKVQTYGSSFDKALENYEKSAANRSELRSDPDEEESDKKQTGGLSAVREPIEIHDIEADSSLVRETMKAAGKTLSREEQQILFRALHARNLEESLRGELFNYLIEKNVNLVRYTAKKMGFRSQDEDWPVIQEGVFGLMVAVKRFDYEVGTMFSTYAYWWIRRAIQGGDLDESGPLKLSLHYRKKRSQARRVFRELTLTLGREPSIEEWAEELDVSTEDLIKIISTGKRAASLDAPASKDSESSAGSFLPDRDSETPEEILSWDETRGEVLKLLGFVPPRKQLIIKMRYGIGTENAEDLILQEIAAILKVSRERIRQLETQAMKDLAEADKTLKAPYTVSPDHADVYLAEKFGILPDSDEFIRLAGVSRKELEKIHEGKFTVRFMNKDFETEIPGVRELPGVVASGYERIRSRLQAFAEAHRVTLNDARVIDLAISPSYVAQYPEILAIEEDQIEKAKIELYELLKSDPSTTPFEVLGRSDAGHLIYWLLHTGKDLPSFRPAEDVLLTLTPQERRVYELSVMLGRSDAHVESQLYAEGLFSREKPVGFQTRGINFIRTSALTKVARGKNGLQLLSEATGVRPSEMTADLIHAIDNRYWRSIQYTYGIRVQKTQNAAQTLQKLREDKIYKWGTEAKGFFEDPQDVELLNRQAYKILRERKTGWDELSAETGLDKSRLMTEDFRYAFPERYWKVLAASYGLDERRILSSEGRLRRLAAAGFDLGNESTVRNTKLRALKMARGIRTGREQVAQEIGVDPAWITEDVINALPEKQKILLKARYGIGMHRIWYEADKGALLALLGVTYKGKPYGRNAIKELTDRALANLKHILLGEDTIEVRIKKFLDANRYQPPIMQQVPEEYGVTREAITRMWETFQKPESDIDAETARLRRVWYSLHPLERRIIQANFGLGEEPAQSLDEISERVKADPELKVWAPSAGKTTLTRSRREAFEAFRQNTTGWTRLGNDIGENRADLETFVKRLLSEKEIDLLRAVYGIDEPRAVSMEHAARLKGYKSGVQVTGKKRDLVEKIRRALVNEGLADPAILEIRKKDMSARKSAGARVWTDQKIREKVASLTDDELNTAALERLGLRSMLNAATAAYVTWDKALLAMGRDPAKIKKKGKLRTDDAVPENSDIEDPGARSELRAAPSRGSFREIRTYEDVVSVNEGRVEEALIAGAITPEKAENYKKTFRGIRRVSAKALQIYAVSARDAGLPVYPVQVVWVGGRVQGNPLKQLESPELERDSDIDLVINFYDSPGLFLLLGKYESLIAAAFIQALSEEDVPGALDYEETLQAAELSERAREILARYREETESKTRIQFIVGNHRKPLRGENVQGHPLNSPELLLAEIESLPEKAEGDELFERSELRADTPEVPEIRTWRQREKDYIRDVLTYTRGVQTEASRILGIDRSTLSRYLKANLAGAEFKGETPSGFTLTTLAKLRRAYVIAALLFYRGNQRSASRQTGIDRRNMHRLLEEHEFESLRMESAESLLQKFSEEVKLAFNQEEVKALLTTRFDSVREAETVKKLSRVLGVKPDRIAEIWPLVERINSREKEDAAAGKFQNEEAFKAATESFKQRIAAGETEDSLFAEAAAVFKAAALFRLGQRPSNEQVAAAIAIHKGSAVEMEPGEGKTLTIALAAYVNALTGRGVHVHTFNSYLALRDAGEMGPVFDLLGMTTGVMTERTSFYRYDPFLRGARKPDKRHLTMKVHEPGQKSRALNKRELYQSDIVYGVKDLFVFDFLQDQKINHQNQRAQRSESPALTVLDEGDATLLDESGTPLILAYEDPSLSGVLRKAEYILLYQTALALSEGEDYAVDTLNENVELKPHGMSRALHYLKYIRFDPSVLTELMRQHELGNLLHQALLTRHFNERDGDYIVKDGKIVLVDEFTGRVKEDYVLGNHRHQFIAAKETYEGNEAAVPPVMAHGGLITYQNYYRMMKRLGRFSMITGTLGNDGEEVSKTYGINFVQIPKQYGLGMIEHPPAMYPSKQEKNKAVIQKILEVHQKGNPIVVFVRRISDARQLRAQLEAEGGIEAAVIDGLDFESEIETLNKAGSKGAVTIATSVAGRGVNIQIDDEVRGLGGLVIVMTRKSKSKRIDDQAKLRTARRGDPGQVYWYLAEEDESFKRFHGQDVSEAFLRKGRQQALFYDDALDPYRQLFYEARNRYVELLGEKGKWARGRDLLLVDLAWQRYLMELEYAMYRRPPEGYLVQVRDGFRFVREILLNGFERESRLADYQEIEKKNHLPLNGYDSDTNRSELREENFHNTIMQYQAYPAAPPVMNLSLEEVMRQIPKWLENPSASRRPVTLIHTLQQGAQNMNLSTVHTPGSVRAIAVRANRSVNPEEIYYLEVERDSPSAIAAMERYLEDAYPGRTFDLEAGVGLLPSGDQDVVMITVNEQAGYAETVPPRVQKLPVHTVSGFPVSQTYNRLTGQTPADVPKLLVTKFRSLDPKDQDRKRSELRAEDEWDLRAVQEWRKPGIPEVRLFDDHIGYYMDDFPAIYKILERAAGKKVNPEEFFEFMTHLSVTRLFRDRYREKFSDVISDLLRGDELLLAMFLYTLKQDLSGTYKKFNAYSELASRFMAHESWYLDLVRRQVDALGTKHLVVAVIGPSFGQELFFWAWIIQRIKTVPGYGDLTYEIIGYEKFEEMAGKSRERIAGRGLDILDVVAAGRGAPEEVLRSSFDLVEAAQTRHQEFSENIRVVTGDARSPELDTLFSKAGIISFNNVWAWMNAAEKKSVITKLKRAAVRNPDVILSGVDVLGGEFQDLKIPRHHPSFRSELRAGAELEVPDSGASALAEFYKPSHQPGAAMIDFRDLVTFTPEEIREAAVVVSQRTEVRFVIHDVSPESEKFLSLKELFKSFPHVVWTQSSGNEAFDSLGPKFKQKGVVAFARKTRDLSEFDAQALKRIRFFAVLEEHPGTFAAALSYDPEQRIFHGGVVREGAFYIVQPLLADLASRYLAQFAFAASA